MYSVFALFFANSLTHAVPAVLNTLGVFEIDLSLKGHYVVFGKKRLPMCTKLLDNKGNILKINPFLKSTLLRR